MTDATLSDMMQLARERFNFSAEATRDVRKKALDDMNVYVGSGQWDSGIQNLRNGDGRPCLVINRLPGAVRQITNQMRRNMPSIHTIPTKDGTKDVAEIYEGMMRYIQDQSMAHGVFATASTTQTICGLGYFRIITEYCDEESFDQEIRLKRIINPLAVYYDPTAVEADKSDAKYCFITSDITSKEFKQRFPGKKAVTQTELQGIGDAVRDWVPAAADDIRIAEYFEVIEEDGGFLYQYEDGLISPFQIEGSKIVNKRAVKRKKVIWRLISAVEELERREWVGKYIPIIPVIGEELEVSGKKVIKGMVRDAADSQRMYNYFVSAQTEMIALAPKAPFIVAEGQLEGYKADWAAANTKSFAYLTYKPTTIAGVPVSPPQRQVNEPPIQALTHAALQAADNIKVTTGVYDASLGARGNETSGKAINSRILQADTANYHFADNLGQSFLYLGRQLIDLIPKIYSTERIVRILLEDGTTQEKVINGPSGEFDANQIEKIYDITTGKYDVTVDIGPSYKTRRQEESDTMTTLLQTNPNLWNVAGDIFAKALDIPESQRLSERLKKMLPPQLQDGEPGQVELPPMVQQRLAQDNQMIEQLTQTLNELQDKLDTKALELESKERIELEKINADIVLKSMEMEGTASLALLQSELSNISKRLELLDINQPIDIDSNDMIS